MEKDVSACHSASDQGRPAAFEEGGQTARMRLTQGERAAMKKAEMKPYRERLLALRARLRGEVHQMADSALRREGGEHSTMPIHMADLGSDTFEQDFTLQLMESEEESLTAIEDALERMDEGTYGDCDSCGAKIPKARLEALPFVSLCVKCAEKEQRK